MATVGVKGLTCIDQHPCQAHHHTPAENQSNADLETLPRQSSLVEVHEDVSERLEVITATLLTAEMCVDAGVPRGACQVLIITELNVLVGVAVNVLLRQTKVNHKHLHTAHKHNTWHFPDKTVASYNSQPNSLTDNDLLDVQIKDMSI